MRMAVDWDAINTSVASEQNRVSAYRNQVSGDLQVRRSKGTGIPKIVSSDSPMTEGLLSKIEHGRNKTTPQTGVLHEEPFYKFSLQLEREERLRRMSGTCHANAS